MRKYNEQLCDELAIQQRGRARALGIIIHGGLKKTCRWGVKCREEEALASLIYREERDDSQPGARW